MTSHSVESLLSWTLRGTFALVSGGLLFALASSTAPRSALANPNTTSGGAPENCNICNGFTKDTVCLKVNNFCNGCQFGSVGNEVVMAGAGMVKTEQTNKCGVKHSGSCQKVGPCTVAGSTAQCTDVDKVVPQ